MGKNIRVCDAAFLFLAAFLLHMTMEVGGAKNLEKDCGLEIPKLTSCLNYASGKKASPPKDCCSAAETLKTSDPACLCYLIEQANNATSPLTKSGIQVDKMLQLSSACQMKNASLSACPGLLGLSPTSPAAAIFVNGTTAAQAPPTVTSNAPIALPNQKSSSTSKHLSFFWGLLVLVVLFQYTFLSAFKSV